MIIDTSALIAIVFGEPEAQNFSDAIAAAEVSRISVASRLELAIVLERRGDSEIARYAELFLRNVRIVEEPVTLQQGFLARNAFYDFGKGRHPAGLNFGDCFAYALAKAMNEPLLFKGDDFAKTDVRPAS